MPLTTDQLIALLQRPVGHCTSHVTRACVCVSASTRTPVQIRVRSRKTVSWTIDMK